MRHPSKKLTALIVVGTLLFTPLTACGNDDNPNEGSGHSFAYTLVGNPDTLDPQLAVNDSAKMVLGNLFEGLFTIDESGSLKPALVTDYSVSEDGLRYLFTLREDSFWYDEMHEDTQFSKDNAVAVTASDFVYAFQRMFNPLYQSPYRETFACIQNAQDIIDGKQDYTMIGVYAKKSNQLEIRLDTPNANFLQLLASTAALPCSEAYFDSTKGRYGLDENSIIGNGGFAMQRWLYDPYGKYNVIQLCRNPLANDVSHVFPIDLSFFIEASDNDAASLFAAGSTDCYVTTQTSMLSRTGITTQSAYSMTLGLVAAPNSPYADPQVMNALALALDREKISANDGDVKTAYGILPPAVTLLNKSCRELIAENVYNRFNAEDAKLALAEGLFSLGQEDLPEGKILVSSGVMDYEPLCSAIEIWEQNLNIHMSIDEVSERDYQNKLNKHDYMLALIAVSGDSQDASSVFEDFLVNPNISCDSEAAIREWLSGASQAENFNACVELYRNAETSILQDNCFIPLFYKNRYLLCQEGVSDVVFNPFSGQLYFYNAKHFD